MSRLNPIRIILAPFLLVSAVLMFIGWMALTGFFHALGKLIGKLPDGRP